jgi:glycosyltransferase involved in cell wall biosynthesis
MVIPMALNVLYIHSSADLYGSDKSLLRLLRHRDPAKISPVVCLPYRGPLVEEIEMLGITVHILEMGVVRRRSLDPVGVAELLVNTVTGARGIYRIIKDEEIDIVHTNTSAVFSGAIAARIARVPHVWHVREIYQLGAVPGKVYAALIDWLSMRIICVSNAVKDHLASYRMKCARKTAVVHNGIAVPECGTEGGPALFLAHRGIPAGNMYIGAVGRINRVKGHEVFVEIASRVKERYPRACFLIAGDVFSLKGDRREARRAEALRKHIQRLGLERDVFLLGYVKNIEEIYGVLDVYLFTSVLPDSFPTTVLEAMASGVPVVASDIGGVRDIITDGENGLLVPAGDVAGFAGAIEKIVTDDALRRRLVQRGKETCRERFTVEKNIREIERIYQGAVQR